jgi:sensor histidine kinase YesM
VIKIQDITQLLIKHRVLWHIGFWLFYAASRALPYYLTVMYYQRNYLEFMLITEGSLAVLVYATIGLYKRFCTEQKYTIYIVFGLILWLSYLALVISFQKFYLRDLPEIANSRWENIYLNSMTKYLVTFVLLTMAKYFKDNFIYQYYENERKKLQAQSELQNLKAQIAPHFLFNTMNNFYGLAVEQSPKLPKLMVRLSELLRYSLYETNHATVPILSEIAYLKNYIELEKIRLEDTLEFEFNVEIDPLSILEIAPLIFIVFVENAFKHAKNVENDVVKITIDLRISKANEVFFTIKNNCLTNLKDVDYNKSGIGLENVRRRLNVLYPNDLHELNVEKMADFFEVKLKIKL